MVQLKDCCMGLGDSHTCFLVVYTDALWPFINQLPRGDGELQLVHNSSSLLLLYSTWDPSHRRQSFMNHCNVGPSHMLQFFKNCCSIWSFPWGTVLQAQTAPAQMDPMGHSSCYKTCSWVGSSPWAIASFKSHPPGPAWGLPQKRECDEESIHKQLYFVDLKRRTETFCSFLGLEKGRIISDTLIKSMYSEPIWRYSHSFMYRFTRKWIQLESKCN